LVLGPREITFRDFLAGLASGFLFFLSIAGQSTQLLAITLPALPLLFIGLSHGFRHVLIASLAAGLSAMLLTGGDNALVFAGFALLPICVFAQRLLMWRDSATGKEWYPVLRALAELTALAACLMAVMFVMAGVEGTHINDMLPHVTAEQMQDLDPKLATGYHDLIERWGFLMFPMGAWLGIGALYALAAAVNSYLRTHGQALRLGLAIAPHGLPEWLPLLFVPCVLLMFTGSAEDHLLGKIDFFVLLLPYFISGLALLHAVTLARQLTYRRLWITCFYVIMATTAWPAVPVIGLGFFVQLSEMLDRHKKIG